MCSVLVWVAEAVPLLEAILRRISVALRHVLIPM